MILATHALVGAAIGKKIGNPWIIIPVVLVVHYFLDGLRHGEYFDDRNATVKNTYKKILLDLTIAFAIILSFIYFDKFDWITCRNVLIGSFFSMFPDLLTVLNYWKPKIKILAQIKKLHGIAHRYSRFPKYSPERAWNLRNAANDLILSSIAILLLFI